MQETKREKTKGQGHRTGRSRHSLQVATATHYQHMTEQQTNHIEGCNKQHEVIPSTYESPAMMRGIIVLFMETEKD